MEPVVEWRPEHDGWEIRDKDQLPGTGMVVTKGWLAVHGFSRPSRFNLDKIIEATVAAHHGYAAIPVDHRELMTTEMTRTNFYIPGGR